MTGLIFGVDPEKNIGDESTKLTKSLGFIFEEGLRGSG